MWLSNVAKISNKLISLEGLIITKREAVQNKRKKEKKMRLGKAFSVIKNNWCKWQKQEKDKQFLMKMITHN